VWGLCSCYTHSLLPVCTPSFYIQYPIREPYTHFLILFALVCPYAVLSLNYPKYPTQTEFAPNITCFDRNTTLKFTQRAFPGQMFKMLYTRQKKFQKSPRKLFQIFKMLYISLISMLQYIVPYSTSREKRSQPKTRCSQVPLSQKKTSKMNKPNKHRGPQTKPSHAFRDITHTL